MNPVPQRKDRERKVKSTRNREIRNNNVSRREFGIREESSSSLMEGHNNRLLPRLGFPLDLDTFAHRCKNKEVMTKQ